MAPRLTMEQRALARGLHGQGRSLREIGAELACSHETVRLVLRSEPVRPARPDEWRPGPGRLTLEEREEISRGLRAGDRCSSIAARLRRSVSSVSREVGANGGPSEYRAWRAHRRARERARRPKMPKLACRRLAAQVEEWLTQWWSPEEIAQRLRLEFLMIR